MRGAWNSSNGSLAGGDRERDKLKLVAPSEKGRPLQLGLQLGEVSQESFTV